MAWKQLVPPDLSIRVWAGWCLSLARQVARAPAREATAWDAWQNVRWWHYPTTGLPNVPVILWFSHWNTYNGVYQNWGHVVYYIPGRGFLSSPGSGYGQEWLSSVAAVVARFGGAYVGWSEDISTQRVAQLITDAPPTIPVTVTEEDQMIFVRNQTSGAVHAYFPALGITLPVPTPQIYVVLQAVAAAKSGAVINLTPAQMIIWFDWQKRMDSEIVRIKKAGNK